MCQPSCWRRWRYWWLYFLGTLSCSDAELFGGHAPTCGQSRQRPSQLVGTRQKLHSSPFRRLLEALHVNRPLDAIRLHAQINVCPVLLDRVSVLTTRLIRAVHQLSIGRIVAIAFALAVQVGDEEIGLAARRAARENMIAGSDLEDVRLAIAAARQMLERNPGL